MDGSVTILATRVERIESLHAEAKRRASSAVEAALECGREIMRAKDDLTRASQGELFDEFASGLSFGGEQATRYVRAAQMVESNPDALQVLNVRHLFVPEKKNSSSTYYEARSQLVDWREIGMDLRRRGFSQQDVATALNIARSTVKSWFNDGSPPLPDDAFRLVFLYERVTGIVIIDKIRHRAESLTLMPKVA
jgi:hypothetical protein